MTTTVTVSVPAGADYKAVVAVREQPGLAPHHYTLSPGDTFTAYVYGQREVSVVEVPIVKIPT